MHRKAPDCGPRLGLIVGKRLIPLAVSRNRVKRLIREGFRAHREQLPMADIIVRVVKKPNQEVSAGDVAALFGKMQRANH